MFLGNDHERCNFQSLPNFTSFLRRPHHRRSFLAAERIRKFRQVREWPDHPEFCDRMRIALYHLPLRLRADLVATDLAPGDEKLLVGGKAIESGCRVLLFRFLKGKVGDLGPRKVSYALAQHQLAVVVNVWLDEVAVELIRHASRAGLKAFQIVSGPP